ncbi:hypothetical protein F6X40_11360 [Paraburkholderia sp. UCT31]|uniref:hypothetical protein n=1 Tax=Paraburkholderia sp. UCT31 TaxID=2615209 RepID=UPI00165570EF|nr:hypothetical protein [Paraburkholderia sp. UCT31]MBC8737402.1 hypothetical protein [Paraburkholderia sp. UCT31]
MNANTQTPSQKEGYAFGESQAIERTANSVLLPQFNTHFGARFREAGMEQQKDGVDFLFKTAVADTARDLRVEMKAESYPQNCFLEFLQAIQSNRKFDNGWVFKNTADYLMLVNMPALYVLVVHRATWLKLGITMAANAIDFGKKPIYGVPNGDRRTAELNRIAYGVPIAYSELVKAMAKEGASFAAFDFRPCIDDTELGEVIRKARNASEDRWDAAPVLRQGRSARGEMISVLKSAGRALDPLESMPAFLDSVTPDAEVTRVVNRATLFLSRAATQAVVTHSARIAQQVKGVYLALSPDVEKTFRVGKMNFYPPALKESVRTA